MAELNAKFLRDYFAGKRAGKVNKNGQAMPGIMAAQEGEPGRLSRRDILAGSAALLTGGLIGGTAAAYAATAAAPREVLPPLPWKWAKLDPLEAGRRAYHNYFRGGCGHASCTALLSMLREKVGYPYTMMPDMMIVHAGSDSSRVETK